MILLIFVASVLVAVLLERQARQHALERTMEYERLGIPVPPRPPKLKRTEAWLNVGLGLILVVLSILSTWTGFLMRSMGNKFPDHAAEMGSAFSEAIQVAAFYLAGGIALAWLGWRAIREISRYESGASSSSVATDMRAAHRGESPSVHRPVRLNTTAVIAAGAFVAGIFTGYLLLSREPSTPASETAGQATVSVHIQAATAAELPPGFAAEIERRFETELGTIPGVRIVRNQTAGFVFNASIGREDGFIAISWEVIRTRDNAQYFKRQFTIPVDSPESRLRVMISSLSSTFGEKRTTSEFERILQLPENSLD